MRFLNLILLIVLNVIFISNSFANEKGEWNENVIVLKNNTVIFDVVESEYIEGSIKQFFLLNQPSYGEAEMNEDHSLSYKPHLDLCEEIDEFRCVVEHEGGMDTVSVSVEILCENLTILNAFYSEEEEEKAPTSFTIVGVENFPENFLYVFNDFGHEVYYRKGYMNDWRGKTKSGEVLPVEKVYYYVFSDGEGQVYSGYLKLN